MEWHIEHGFFQPVRIRFKNSVWREIQRKISAIRPIFDDYDATLYLRGSALEAREPHPKSDIDFVLVAERPYWRELHRLLHDTIQIERRPVDIYLMESSQIESNLLMRLLLHTRSERIAGPALPMAPVRADFATAKAHWDMFSVQKLPSALISNHETNACMVKQLLRSIGPIELVNHGRFSRHLPTCVRWIEERAPQNIVPYFQQAWNHIGTRQNPPLPIQPAKDWLIREWVKIERKNNS